MSDILEKWECTDCHKSFLVNAETADGKDLDCPYCHQMAECVASSAPEDAEEVRDMMGCLFPNDYDCDH